MPAFESDSPAHLLAHTSHRPWPLPDHHWVMTQTWSNLLFAHWPVEYARVRERVPAELPLDSFDGRAWIGIASFGMDLRPRGLPLLLMRGTPELNVRTYVTIDGKAGVYFFSLDILSFAAVLGARALYHLPYYPARMSMIASEQPEVRYASERLAWRRNAQFRAAYRPAGEPIAAHPGSLEYFFAERYCLYTAQRAAVFRVEIHHLPWPLQAANAEIAENTVASAAGLPLPRVDPVTHFCRRLSVLVWPPRRVAQRVMLTVPQPRHAGA